jgi:hypothetical protein
MRLKVVQWATGRIGVESIKGIASHPMLDLVGVGVYDPAKVGRDAGDLAGVENLGVSAVPVQALAEMEADCAVHTPVGEFDPDQAVGEICSLLRSGKNVCSTAVMSLVHPKTMDPKHKAAIEAACQAGSATFHATGINPGFFADVMTLTVAGLSSRIEHIHAIESYNYEHHTSRTTVVDLLKFGRPPEEAAKPRAYKVGPAEPGLYMLADAMGFTIDRIERQREEQQAETPFDITATHIAAGTHAAHRYIITAYVGGVERIRFEFIGRAAPHFAPNWPEAARSGIHRWTNRIKGEPDVESSVEIGPKSNALAGASSTALRAVNAVIPVCKAAPGIVTILDLGLLTAPLR